MKKQDIVLIFMSCMIVILILLTGYNFVNNTVPLLYYQNHNYCQDFLNSAGVYVDDNRCDRWGADALIYTLLSNKECVVNPNGFFSPYADAMFEKVQHSNAIPEIVSEEELSFGDNFIKVGISLSRNNKTLFPFKLENEEYRFHNSIVYINPKGIIDSGQVVLMNDGNANLYLVAANVWNENGIEKNEQESLGTLISSLTHKYRFKSILVSMVLYFLGYFLIAICNPNSKLLPYLAFPVAVSLWTVISIFLLVMKIEYTLFSASISILFIVFSIFMVHRRNIIKINVKKMGIHFIGAIVLAFIMTSAFVPIIHTYDSYLFVYQYGHLIYQCGYIGYENVGALIGVTGIASALLVALARFGGFESIQLFHWLLVMSMLGVLTFFIRKKLGEYLDAKNALAVSILIVLIMFIIPAFSRMILMVNSLTYVMVFITLITLIGLHEKDNINCWNIFISLFIIELSFLRLEGGVLSLFFLICLGRLHFGKWNLAFLAFPGALFQIVYFLRIITDSRFYSLATRDFFLSKTATTVIFLSAVIAILYSFMYDVKIMNRIHNNFSKIYLIGFFVICILMGILHPAKTMTDILSVFGNLTSDSWNYFTYIIGGVFLITGYYKKQISWGETVVLGFSLLNFGMCLGRNEPLRIGFGDSYNRMLCTLIPLIVYVLVDRSSWLYQMRRCLGEKGMTVKE